MSKITSDLTSKSFPKQQMRQFDVSDESDVEDLPPNDIDFAMIDGDRIARGLPALDISTKRAMIASQAQQGKRQTFNSTTAEDDISVQKLAELEKTIQAAKQNRVNGTEKLSQTAKRRIESLLNMSKSVREVDIDENKFLLRTLKGKEQRAAIVATTQYDGTADAAFEIRKQLLGRALVQINGTDLELFLGDTSLEARMEFIDEMEEPALIKLYTEYLAMVEETQNKYFVKTEEDAKEVMEDIKK